MYCMSYCTLVQHTEYKYNYIINIEQIINCDPLYENPAKVIFLRLTIFYIKSSYIL